MVLRDCSVFPEFDAILSEQTNHKCINVQQENKKLLSVRFRSCRTEWFQFKLIVDVVKLKQAYKILIYMLIN